MRKSTERKDYKLTNEEREVAIKASLEEGGRSDVAVAKVRYNRDGQGYRYLAAMIIAEALNITVGEYCDMEEIEVARRLNLLIM